MIALDTNVLVRFLTADDKPQAARAKALLSKKEVCWVPVTVLLELAWVLGGYAWDNVKIARTLRELIGENVINPQHPEAVSRALRWAEAGMAFADALHLALSASATEFASFDDALRKKAAALGISPTVTAP